MMTIKLTKEQKVYLLESVQTGTLDLNRIGREDFAALSRPELLRELCRLECAKDPAFLKAKADYLRKFAAGEISQREYTNSILSFLGYSVNSNNAKR